MGAKGILCYQANEITCLANSDFGFEGEVALQCCQEPCSWSGLPNYEGTCSADADEIVVSQFESEESRAKGSVTADIDASKEDDEGHVVEV